MNFEKDIFPVGKIVNTFGKKGTVKLLIEDNYWINDESDFINKILLFKENDIYEPLKIIKAVISKDNLLMIDFENYNSINKSERLKNKKIYSVKKDDLFIEQVDYKLYTMNFSLDNKEIKLNIIDLMENGQYTLFKIKINDKEVWIPGVEEYIEYIDDEQRIIFAKNIERFI